MGPPSMAPSFVEGRLASLLLLSWLHPRAEGVATIAAGLLILK